MILAGWCVPDRALRWGGVYLDDFAPDLTAPGDVFAHLAFTPVQLLDQFPIVRVTAHRPVTFVKGDWS